MDFRQSSQPGVRPATPGQPNTTSTPPKAHRGALSDDEKRGKWLRLMTAVILFGIAILIASVAFTFTRSNSHNEFKYVDTSKYQAVFLTNGQVYFGHIASLNDKYVQLDSIYYLTQSTASASSSSTAASSNYTLVKLGCQQIHDPFDEMVINRGQVTFWENLQDSGKVVASINQYKQSIKNQTPAQICAQVSSQTQASPTSTTTQGATTTTKP